MTRDKKVARRLVEDDDIVPVDSVSRDTARCLFIRKLGKDVDRDHDAIVELLDAPGCIPLAVVQPRTSASGGRGIPYGIISTSSIRAEGKKQPCSGAALQIVGGSAKLPSSERWRSRLINFPSIISLLPICCHL